jgi:hypothetical protein
LNCLTVFYFLNTLGCLNPLNKLFNLNYNIYKIKNFNNLIIKKNNLLFQNLNNIWKKTSIKKIAKFKVKSKYIFLRFYFKSFGY